MNSRNLVICDREIEYASRLAKYLEGKRELALQVKICDSPEQVAWLGREARMDILMIDDRLSLGEKELADIPTVIRLTSQPSGRHGEESTHRIYRYQKASEIYAELLQVLASTGTGEQWGIRKKERGKLIGVYSPVHRLGQTAFALGKGAELAKKGNVLYINLESYAGIGGYFPEENEKNLSMLLYYAKQELGNPGLLLAAIAKQIGEVDYIPPVLFSEDLKTVSGREWIWLFEEILNRSIYDVLILDLGDCIQGLFDILRMCDTVYVPMADDPIAVSKLYQFEECLCRQGYGEVWERMIRCDIRGTVKSKGAETSGSVERDRG